MTVIEESAGTVVIQTGFQLLYDDVEERVRIELKGREGNPDFYQVILTDRRRALLSHGIQTCTAWDGNDDGYEDILYYAGYDGGSGGIWDDYKLCDRGQSGAPHQFYWIYGLQDGEYLLEKGLDLYYEHWNGEEMVNIAVYSEYGEIVEETDITGLDWEETQVLLEEKYPEFHFWRQG